MTLARPSKVSTDRTPTGRSVRGSARPIAFAVAILVLVAACAPTGGSSGLPTLDPNAASAGTSPSAEPSGADASVGAGCPTSQPDPLPAGQTRTVTIDTPKGAIALEIDGALSPIAAGNFVALAGCGYYDGVVFHRLVPGFVIQGGDGQFGRVGTDGKLPGSSQGLVGTGGPGYTIKDEPVTTPYGRGVVAMARTSEPDSVGSQFFIVLDDAAASALAQYNTYQIIGKVSDGMDVVDAIAAMPNSGSPDNAALDPVPMTKVGVSQ